uniref:Integrase, catalytic region, zinc finger, CCHC-type, peptidase aspartic, catalytic n=1 Tax=Tanacetum cinerariifolium TaxID=118510 RepID=A0A699GQL0_TANCI|nr:hypothetical protein [Tanacetum cinerariifolium]
MANLSKDIKCDGSDTRPPMLDRTDFGSWKQRIRLYCRGKENGVNILKSIDEGPYQMGRVRETLAESTERAPQFGSERPRDNVKMLLEGPELTKENRESQLYDDFEHFQQHKGESIHDYYVRFAKLINDMRNIKMTMSRLQLNCKFVNTMLPEWGWKCCWIWGAQNRVGNANPGQARPGEARHVKCYNCNALDEEQLLFLAGGQDNAFDDDVDEKPVQDMALNVDNVFQADDCDTFDSDVDEAPTAQTMFMANLSSADPITDEAGPSYDSDIISEVQDHDHYQDAVCAHQKEHVMHDSVQLDHVVDSHADYTSDSNMISYDQYVKDNKPALYNGHEIIKDNHASAIMHNIEDTLEIAEITRKKINAKMNDPECVTQTTDPRTNLLSNDLIKLKSEALKEQTKVSRPIKALTVGFEQTKECYLKEVIPFFKTLKDNFEGIQKALTKKIKEMKDVFKELEAEVAQYAVDRKHDAIKRKNLLIANDNLIAEYLSKEVFSVATNSELNVARFTEMHATNTTVKARCLALKAELVNLRDKSHHDNQEELINNFSKLEVNDVVKSILI